MATSKIFIYNFEPKNSNNTVKYCRTTRHLIIQSTPGTVVFRNHFCLQQRFGYFLFLRTKIFSYSSTFSIFIFGAINIQVPASNHHQAAGSFCENKPKNVTYFFCEKGDEKINLSIELLLTIYRFTDFFKSYETRIRSNHG